MISVFFVLVFTACKSEDLESEVESVLNTGDDVRFIENTKLRINIEKMQASEMSKTKGKTRTTPQQTENQTLSFLECSVEAGQMMMLEDGTQIQLLENGKFIATKKTQYIRTILLQDFHGTMGKYCPFEFEGERYLSPKHTPVLFRRTEVVDYLTFNNRGIVCNEKMLMTNTTQPIEVDDKTIPVGSEISVYLRWFVLIGDPYLEITCRYEKPLLKVLSESISYKVIRKASI